MLIMVFVYVFISLQTMVKRVIKVHRDWTPLNTLVKKYEIEEVIFSFRVCVCVRMRARAASNLQLHS